MCARGAGEGVGGGGCVQASHALRNFPTCFSASFFATVQAVVGGTPTSTHSPQVTTVPFTCHAGRRRAHAYPPAAGHTWGGSTTAPRDGLLHPGSRLDASSPSNHSDKSASPSSLQTRWQRRYARTDTGMAHARAPPDERPGKPFAVTFSLHGIFSGPRTVGTVAVMINIWVSFTPARFVVVVVTIRT